MNSIVGIGTDIVETARLESARYPKRIAEFFFQKNELEDMERSEDQMRFITSRFAAKEAVIKACPVALTYHDILISKDGSRPTARILAPQGECYDVFLSLSHEYNYVIACAVVCTNK